MGITFGPKKPKGDLAPKKRKVNYKDNTEKAIVGLMNDANTGKRDFVDFREKPKKEIATYKAGTKSVHPEDEVNPISEQSTSTHPEDVKVESPKAASLAIKADLKKSTTSFDSKPEVKSLSASGMNNEMERVAAYQKRRGIEATGVWGEKTKAVYNKEQAAKKTITVGRPAVESKQDTAVQAPVKGSNQSAKRQPPKVVMDTANPRYKGLKDMYDKRTAANVAVQKRRDAGSYQKVKGQVDSIKSDVDFMGGNMDGTPVVDVTGATEKIAKHQISLKEAMDKRKVPEYVTQEAGDFAGGVKSGLKNTNGASTTLQAAASITEKLGKSKGKIGNLAKAANLAVTGYDAYRTGSEEYEKTGDISRAAGATTGALARGAAIRGSVKTAGSAIGNSAKNISLAAKSGKGTVGGAIAKGVKEAVSNTTVGKAYNNTVGKAVSTAKNATQVKANVAASKVKPGSTFKASRKTINNVNQKIDTKIKTGNPSQYSQGSVHPKPKIKLTNSGSKPRIRMGVNGQQSSVVSQLTVPKPRIRLNSKATTQTTASKSPLTKPNITALNSKAASVATAQRPNLNSSSGTSYRIVNGKKMPAKGSVVTSKPNKPKSGATIKIVNGKRIN